MQHNGKSFRWRRRVHLNDTPSDPFETKKMRKQYTRELKYDHQRQSVSHFEKYMYLLLFSLNYIVIPNPASICSFKLITTLIIYAEML